MEMYTPLYCRPEFLALFFGCFCTAVLLIPLGIRFFRDKLALSRSSAYLLVVATVLAAAGDGFYEVYQLNHMQHPLPDEEILIVICGVFGILFVIPLIVTLYRAWIGGYCTSRERLPGIAGIRAWLAPLNLLFVFAVSFCATKTLGYPFLTTLALLVMLLLIYPILNTVMSPSISAGQREEALGSEREKVLSMLDAGKITAEESADLLNALGSAARTQKPAGSPRQQRLALLGAALVLIGFLLPWFSINPGKELRDLAGQMQSGMAPFHFQQNMNITGIPTLGQGFDMTPTVYISGGDVSRGLGWLVLGLGIAAALLPIVASNMDHSTRRMAFLLALGSGSVILLYLVTQNLRLSLNVGIVITATGYGLLWMSIIEAPAGRTLPSERSPI